jgi:hypothetical protein
VTAAWLAEPCWLVEYPVFSDGLRHYTDRGIADKEITEFCADTGADRSDVAVRRATRPCVLVVADCCGYTAGDDDSLPLHLTDPQDQDEVLAVERVVEKGTETVWRCATGYGCRRWEDVP